MRQFSFKTSRRAFTLVQMVIALTILMGLAIVFFPVHGRGGWPSRRSSCQSNLKQIMLGFKQYTQDYNEQYPVWQHGPNAAQGWAVSIQPYLKNTQLYQCPSETTPADSNPANIGYCDYFYNFSFGPQKGEKSEADIEGSATTIIIGDSAPYSSGNSTSGGAVTSPGVNGTQSGLAVAQRQWNPAVAGSRHLEGGNYGFADGHVKWLKPEKVTREPLSTKLHPTFRLTSKNPPISGS